jgi:hypothetical protein
MLSPVQAIIAAEAGVNARAENIAAVIKILINTLPENETSILLANEIRFRRPKRFQRNKFLCAAMQRNLVSRNELATAENKGGLNAKDLDSGRRRGCGVLQRGVCPNRRRQRHQRWRRGQIGLGCDRAREHDGQGRHGEERAENDEEKEGVIDTVTALAMCLAARRS